MFQYFSSDECIKHNEIHMCFNDWCCRWISIRLGPLYEDNVKNVLFVFYFKLFLELSWWSIILVVHIIICNNLKCHLRLKETYKCVHVMIYNNLLNTLSYKIFTLAWERRGLLKNLNSVIIFSPSYFSHLSLSNMCLIPSFLKIF